MNKNIDNEILSEISNFLDSISQFEDYMMENQFLYYSLSELVILLRLSLQILKEKIDRS